MDRLLIVDGMNLIFQMFYGMPSRIIGRNGRPIQGTLGFIGALLKMIRRFAPSHVGVIFDGESHNPRTDLDSEYKANRPDWSKVPEEDAPFSQLPDVYAALDWLGIRHFETSSCECDDVIAAYARHYGREREVIIMSQDSDFFQLINGRVSVLRYRGDSTALCDASYVISRCGVSPEYYADWKSLVGDTSDNVKGAPGIGPKTAASLIYRFGSLEEIIRRADEIERPSVRASVVESKERLKINAALIRLCGCTELPFALEDMLVPAHLPGTSTVLSAIGL